MGPGRSSVLLIGSNSAEASSSGRNGGNDNLAVVVHRAAPREPPFPLDKGKDKINEIRYPSGSEYLRAAIQNAEVVGPSRVEPLYGEIFAARYRPLFEVQVWCPDVLTTYVVQVPKMVCFFEVAFENDLCFPLHPFIKRVMQHFNVCPSQLSPNFRGVLVGLLVVLRPGCSQYCLAFRLLQCKGGRRRLSLYLQALQRQVDHFGPSIFG